MSPSTGRAAADAFHRLHGQPEILVLPGVWDVASARVFAARGFPALGTTSTGIAWSLGHPTGQAVGWPAFLEAHRKIAAAVAVPVSFDIESGFDDDARRVGEHVREAIEAGACGINLEDGFVDGVFADPRVQEDKIHVIREVCAALDFPLFLNARTDVYLGGIPDEAKRQGETIRRVRRYEEAGADGIFVPGVTAPDEIRAIAREISIPLNVYALPGLPSGARLWDLGARRVSLGCGPLQAVLARTVQIADSVRDGRSWGGFTDDWLEYGDATALCAGIP